MPAKLVAQTVEAFGGLDILVTNAGGPPPGPFESHDDANWQKGIDLSLMSRNAWGGTAPQAVKEQLEIARGVLGVKLY